MEGASPQPQGSDGALEVVGCQAASCWTDTNDLTSAVVALVAALLDAMNARFIRCGIGRDVGGMSPGRHFAWGPGASGSEVAQLEQTSPWKERTTQRLKRWLCVTDSLVEKSLEVDGDVLEALNRENGNGTSRRRREHKTASKGLGIPSGDLRNSGRRCGRGTRSHPLGRARVRLLWRASEPRL